MGLYQQTKALWTPQAEQRSARWAAAALQGLEAVEAAGEKFREWRPLRFYVALGTRATGARAIFSVRFFGQEVAQVEVTQSPALVVSARHATANQKYFGLATPAGSYPWNGREATAFRKAFRVLADSQGPIKPRSTEHVFESRLLEEMESTVAEEKFAGTFADVRHVGLTRHEYPFQCPVPISASAGMPAGRIGHVDVLARRGLGKPRLSVWELKAPGQLQRVVAQAYIYSVEFALMLRGQGGADWWRLFGFSGKLPAKLEFEAVAAVTVDKVEGVRAQAVQLMADEPLVLADERVTLRLFVACYDEETMALDFRPLR